MVVGREVLSQMNCTPSNVIARATAEGREGGTKVSNERENGSLEHFPATVDEERIGTESYETVKLS